MLINLTIWSLSGYMGLNLPRQHFADVIVGQNFDGNTPYTDATRWLKRARKHGWTQTTQAARTLQNRTQATAYTSAVAKAS